MAGLGQDPKIIVAGAGSIGCYVGGMLQKGGKQVAFLARPRIIDEVKSHGLTCTDFLDAKFVTSGEEVDISPDPGILGTADIILVTVKSGATRSIAADIRDNARATAIVISLQNGTTNADILREELPDHTVIAGMVPFNVAHQGSGHFHRGTSGDIMIDEGVPGLGAALSTAELPFLEDPDMPGVLWGKLLVNLNNALVALSGLTLREELMTRAWRVIMSRQMREGLRALKKAGIQPRAALPLPPSMLPWIMVLPNSLYQLVAANSIKVDPKATSSMFEDLALGRKTEIDELQGAVISLAERHGLTAPVNARVRDLIKQAEQKGRSSPNLSPESILYKNG